MAKTEPSASPSGLPANAPPAIDWRKDQPTPAASSSRSPTTAGLRQEYSGAGATTPGYDPAHLAVWGIDGERAVLPVLWERRAVQQPGKSFEFRPGNPDAGLHGGPGVMGSDVTKSYLQSLQSFYAFSGDQLKNVQTAMWGLGLLPSNWNPGMLGNNNDKDSADAWKTVVQLAMQSEKTIWEVLQGGMSPEALSGRGGPGRGGGRGAGARRAPLSIRYSNPEDLKEAARQTALDTIGYVPGDEFLGDFVKLYQGLEAGSQRKAYAGGNYTDPGNPQVQAQKELREDYSTQAGAFSTVKTFDALLGIIGAKEGIAGGS